jgi:hypothetical protein
MGAPARAGARRRAALLALALLAAALAFPGLAWADFASNINDMLKGLITPNAEWINESIQGMFQDTSSLGLGFGASVNAGLDNLFGDGIGGDVLGVCTAVESKFMRPCAATILTFCLMVQLVHASQHTNAGATLPGVWEVAGIIVFYCIFSVLIGSSDRLVNLIYLLSQGALGALEESVSLLDGVDSGLLLDTAAIESMDFTSDPGGALWLAGGLFLIGCVLFVARISCTFFVMGRAIQIYIMTMFSPIPLALLGANETRQMGVGFLKNVAALCFSVVIMVMVIYLFQLLVCQGLNGILDTETGKIDGGSLVNVLVATVLLIIGLGKSGAWAREVLGG